MATSPGKTTRVNRWLAAVVLGHLIVTFAHGAAHSGAHVALGTASALFVLLVIEIAPLVGLAWSTRNRRASGWLVATSMAAAFLFGLVNHFLVISPDHISQVDPSWSTSFGITAGLLAALEIAGAVLGARHATQSVEEYA